MTGTQIPLGLRWRERAELDSFVPGPNAAVLAAVLALASGRVQAPLLVWGPSSSGKTHLLQAGCQQASRRRLGSVYLPLRDGDPAIVPEVLGGLEHCALVCLDDVDAVVGDSRWEEALFHLYNRCDASGSGLLISADGPASGLGIQLPDLHSRLSACVALPLRVLPDADRAEILRSRADQRGLELPDEVVAYLLGRYPRDLASLVELLDRLDIAALAGKRRITVPLARAVLEPPVAGGE